MPSPGPMLPSGNDPYEPPQSLVDSTGLSREVLISLFESYVGSLHNVENTPGFVFGELLNNVRKICNESFDRERNKHAATQEYWLREKSALWLELYNLTSAVKEIGNFTGYSRTTFVPASGTITPKTKHCKQIYLQFLFSNSSNNQSTRVRAVTTTIPIPYGFYGCWDDVTPIFDRQGSYDTRMDDRITARMLPGTVTHIVRFDRRFHWPPYVVVWLTGLSALSGAAISVQASAHDIEETGFSLRINSGAGAFVASVGVAWAAWVEVGPWGGPTAKGGSFSTITSATPRESKLWMAGSLPQNAVAVRNKLLGICAVDLVLEGNMWMNVSLSMPNLDPKDQHHESIELPSDEPVMRWEMTAGPADANVYSAEVTYAG